MRHAAADALAAFCALQHLAFMVLEMFFWRKPLGLRIFRMTPQIAEASATLALNQGLYNGFLAAGLMWGLACADPARGAAVKTFFLACVVAAGLLGGLTVSWRVAAIQAGPALLALALRAL